MGTTPVFGWPYPDGTGLVINGDDDIQALAGAIETDLTPTYLKVAANGPSTLTAAGSDLTFPLTGNAVGFSRPGDAEDIVYTGPDRWHLIHGTLNFYGAGTYTTSLALRVNAATLRATKLAVTVTAEHSLAVTALVLLSSGDVINLTYTGSADTSFGSGGLDCMALGLVVPS